MVDGVFSMCPCANALPLAAAFHSKGQNCILVQPSLPSISIGVAGDMDP
jgi:hypothetical protein